MSSIPLSPITAPRFGIAGHAGIGHAYSHSGFVQEDSGGFALLMALLHQICPFDLAVDAVSVLPGGTTVQVSTKGGGMGEASARRGFTPFEERLMQRVCGISSYAPQTIATHAFGRVYGQGVMESAAAFCLAVAKALADTVRKAWPHETFSAPENLPGACGEFLCGGIRIHGVEACWFLSINASEGGTGPVEDAEGCVPVGNKGRLMRALGMDAVPIIMLEGKSYIPQMGEQFQGTTLLVRWNRDYDNPIVGECLAEAAAKSGFPYMVMDTTYPRMDGALEKNTKATGTAVAELGKAFADASHAGQKIAIAAELARMVSEDLGGSIFMSNAIHQYAGSGGMWPGYGAMLSWTMDKASIERWRIPVIEDLDIEHGLIVLLEAARLLIPRCEEAAAILRQRRPRLSQEHIDALASIPGPR